MLVVYILGSAFEAVANWMMARISQGALERSAPRPVRAPADAAAASIFDTHPAGELMSRLTNDIEAINQAISQNVIATDRQHASRWSGSSSPCSCSTPGWRWSALMVVPMMFWFTEFVARYTRKGFRELQRAAGWAERQSWKNRSAASGWSKPSGATMRPSQAFREHNDEVYRVRRSMPNSYALLLMPLTNVLGNFFVIVLAGVGGWLALAGLVTVGVIATFISYARNFIQPLHQLANMYNSIQAALAGAERVFEIIDTPSRTPG